MKHTPINELKQKIDLLINAEIEQAMKNKVYEKLKISDLPQIQVYTYILSLIDKMDLVGYEKQIIINAWDDMSEAKNGEEYYVNNFEI